MFFSTSVDQFQIIESELVINSVNQKKIPLCEIKKVFVSVKKIPATYEMMYIVIGGVFIGFNFNFYPVGFYFWMVSGLYLIGEYIIHNYKSCTLNLELQNGKLQFRFIPYSLKYLLINKISEIKISRQSCYLMNTK